MKGWRSSYRDRRGRKGQGEGRKANKEGEKVGSRSKRGQGEGKKSWISTGDTMK